MTNKIKIVWNAMTAEMIDPAIVSVQASASTLQGRIHQVLVAIAADWHATTDQKTAVKRVNALIDGMPVGVRRQAIVAYALSSKHFGMLQKETSVEGAKPGTTKTVKVIAAGKKKAKNLDMEFIAGSFWYTLVKEPEFRPFDLNARIANLMAEVAKMQKRADKRDNLPAEIVTALRAVEKMTVTS